MNAKRYGKSMAVHSHSESCTLTLSHFPSLLPPKWHWLNSLQPHLHPPPSTLICFILSFKRLLTTQTCISKLYCAVTHRNSLSIFPSLLLLLSSNTIFFLIPQRPEEQTSTVRQLSKLHFHISGAGLLFFFFGGGWLFSIRA